MPLSPAPILPGGSPLPPPGQRPPDRRALRVAVFLTLPPLIALLVIGQLFMTQIVFFTPGLQAQAETDGNGDGGSASYQGFVFSWTRRDAQANPSGGFTKAASLQNLKLQADTFHMNAVIIPVVADMPIRSGSTLLWRPTDKGNLDTLPDGDYEAAIKDARKANLLPILELVVKQQDKAVSGTDESSTLVGKAWDGQLSGSSFGLEGGGKAQVATTERGWFDAYSAFASHFAQMSERYHLPYFIIGDRLSSVTTDNDKTSKKTDPAGIDSGVPGELLNCTLGRRDCEWRHVINAIRSSDYSTYQHQPSDGGGGNYTGKLIYSANWGLDGAAEFEKITWWDAVDYIGVAAYFPLSPGNAGLSVSDLVNSWHGKTDDPTNEGDIYTRLGKVSDKYFHPIIFTSAGYESVPGSNSSPGTTSGSDPDQSEQLSDMQALTATFSQASWWAGVFWSAEQPLTPHSAQANWALSTAWAGDTLAASKASGQWLAQYYKPHSLPCGC